MSNIIDKIKNLPQAPGVYFFYGADKELLYIGKATNLRTRAQSYFRNVISTEAPPVGGASGEIWTQISRQARDDKYKVPGRSEWIGLMVAQVTDIAFQETDSVLEALILESNLIKKHQPKYNTLEKDDKSFSYFAITKEDFPRVLIVRYTDSLKISNFKFQISNQFQESPVYHPALDAGSSKSHYLKSSLDSHFHGNDKNEKPGKKILNTKYDIQYTKIYGPYTSKQQMQIALKIIRRIFPFHSLTQKSEKGCLDFQLGVCPGPYVNAISKDDYKKNIRGIKMILEGKKKSLLKMLEKEMQASAKKEEFEKAASLRNKIYALEHIRDVALMTREFNEDKFQITNDKFQTNSKLQESNLGDMQNTEYKIQNTRIEAYDISNISGDHAVGSMVVFENGKPNKAEYRKFKIKTVKGSNDVAMMKEVLARRFNNDWPMPDLILLDGGQGHVNMAEKLLLEELGLAVAIAGVAKGPSRKNLKLQMTNNKQITNDKLQNSIKDILDNKNLLKVIMDEAHRFAITYHRKVRRRNSLT